MITVDKFTLAADLHAAFLPPAPPPASAVIAFLFGIAVAHLSFSCYSAALRCVASVVVLVSPPAASSCHSLPGGSFGLPRLERFACA